MRNSILLIAKPLLSNSETTQFIRDLDFACENMSFCGLKEIITKYHLDDYTDAQVFLMQGKHIFGDNTENVKVISVENRDSKCIACSFGKVVKVFDVKYKKMLDEILPGRIIYTASFAINLDIKNGELIDFAWCNAFLNKVEVLQLAR